MKELRSLLYDSAVIPVIKIETPEKADGLAEALRSGGVRVAEITFRTKAAPGVIERFASHHPDILVGAGTVINCDEVDEAISAGAVFIVSPGFNPSVVEYCLNKNVPIFPGVNTPSLIEEAMGYGLSILKFFPAEVSGGVKALKAFESVYPQVSFIPTGGIQENNVNEYLSCKNVLACGGSWIVPTDMIEAEEFAKITALIRACRRTILGFLPRAHSSCSLDFTSACIEIRTPNLTRALSLLQADGFHAIPGTEVYEGSTMLSVEVALSQSGVRILLVK